MRRVSLTKRPQERSSVAGPILALRGPMVDTYPQGRVCRRYDCETLLSIYNGGEYCAVHESKGIRATGTYVS